MKIQYVAAMAIGIACAATGCASVHRVGADADSRAKMFAPVEGKAVIYIYRNELMGAAITLPVTVDGAAIGGTGPHTYFEVAVPAGKHTITSKGESTTDISLDTTAGQVYYVWQEVKMGLLYARSKLHIVDATEGQKGVGESKLLATEAPALRVPTDVIASPAPDSTASASTAPAAASPAAPAEPASSTAPVATPSAVATPTTTVATTTTDGSIQPEGGIAALDSRIGKPMFDAAQDLASHHQCERLLRIRSVDGDSAHFYSRCEGSSTPIEILCNGASCHEGAPQG